MKNFLVIAFVLLVFGVSAQTIPSQNLIGVGLSSPEAASLGKFGNIPVSYSTGVPNITIPIFDINVGGLKLPISLDYHAGGVRVDEVSSSVGIGWALNAGGVLSRQMVGFPDEIQPGYLSSPALDQVYNNPTNYVSFLYANTLGQNDVNPDVFTYTIPGSSGRFIIKQDGSFLQFPTTNNRIENYTGTCYKITDQDGVGFIFEQKETTSMGMVNGVNLIPSYTSAWRLTKIVSASLADTVFINYESVANLIQNNKSYSHTIGSQPTCAGAPTPTNPNGNFYGGDTYTNQMVTVSESYPTSITWRGGQINFINVADRTDRVSGKRVSEIDVYAKNNGTLTLIKQGKLTQSYFYYLPQNYSVPQDIGNESLYRLRLDAVSFYDVNNVLPPQVYSMTYDNTPMAPRESCAQDVWGFNNGQFGNTTMMPQQTVYFDALHSGAASAYTFGSANRSTNVNYINACSIQSITYPTGGKSVFSLEPHKFNTNTTQTSPGNVECRATGSMQSSNTQTLAVTSSMTNLEYAFYFSADPNATQRPQITITDQATGQVVMTVNDMNPPTSFSSTGLFNVNGSPQLLVGHTYTILTNIYSTDPNAYAYIDVNWVNQTNIPLILQGGGLRIKTITNYDANGAQISQKSFSYGSDGTGTLLTPYNYFALNTQNTVYRIGCLVPDGLGGGQCSYSYGWPSVIYYANSVVPISQFTGSPVLYGGVTEYDAASDGSMNNGKKVYSYQISQDQQVLAYNDYTFTGVQLVSNIWRNGYLSEEQTYKSNGPSSYYLVNDKVHNYVTVRQGSIPQLRIHPKFTDDPHTCSLYSASWLNNDMWLDSYTLPYAAILLQNDTETQIDDSGNQVVRQTNYYYDDLTHVLPTRRETFDSKQEDLVDSINYPHNLAVAGNVYQTMLTRNMISPVVSYAQKKNGSQLVYGQVNYKDWNGNGSLLAPQTMTKQTLTNALETLINFDNYDKYSNILQQEKTSAPSNSYLWDYYNQYPIAKVSGANNIDIAYTSFEANGTGNWTIGSASRNTVGITGSQCYTLSNGAISK
ncbi:MAG TPA: hypothetical protein VL442_10230, partial [Mucilaginibacter sp.]|nr:hypothetical protein [Mucilaginibacter sp.]